MAEAQARRVSLQKRLALLEEELVRLRRELSTLGEDQRNAIMVLMSVEIILNAAILNLVAFWRFVRPDNFDAQVFAIIAVTIGAVEMA
ncbi:MAG: NADH-quinone oxidoreductase subunit K, partial [Gemmatimonadetes bacterium]|nr:NADH-quinone oxidoreductase subunit K [Gemmatimonadota bacterium]